MKRPRALVISNIAWSFVWQRHQSLTALLARDYEAGFIELAGTRAPGWRDLGRVWRHLRAKPAPRAESAPVWLSRPLVLPATNRWFMAINAWRLNRWLRRDRRLRDRFDLVVCYAQTRTALQLLDRIQFDRLVYDCTDDWLEVAGIPASLEQDEKELLRRSDLTLVPSATLWERKAPAARRCVQLPHGAWLERFDVPDKPRGESVTCLYYGHLLRQHLDFAVVEAIARAHPDWRIILVGPVKTTHVFPANVELPGQVRHVDLAEWIRQADVILLPYAQNRYTEAVMPAKTYEVLATGRPVVAAPLPELTRSFGEHMEFASTAATWPLAVERALAEDTLARRNARRAAAQAHSWDARYAELKQLLDVPTCSDPNFAP